MYNFQRLQAIFLLLITNSVFAEIDRVDPPNWWAGMHSQDLQLMFYGEGIGDLNVKSESVSVTVSKFFAGDSENYLFVDLILEKGLSAGEVSLSFSKKGEKIFTYDYPVFKRRAGSAARQGFSSKDVIYLVVPDRFANGDYSNDQVKSMSEGVDRSDDWARHGGDLQGLLDNLDYLESLGITQLWMTPILENNLDKATYHGYAISDLYKVDPRLGSNQLYQKLSSEAQKRGIGIIHDLVLNHIGGGHPWMKDIPQNDWVHNAGTYIRTNDRHEAIIDPYASVYDKQRMVTGWFDSIMPDLDQRNPQLARYLTQNAIWWIETADLSGIRIDTWAYLHTSFMPRFINDIFSEYPDFNIVGEESDWNPRIVSYWQKGKTNEDGFNAGIPSMMDFPLAHAMVDAFSEDESWNTGLSNIYRTIANDSVYPNPKNLVIFADNHDRTRFLQSINDDVSRFKMAMIFLLTTRGIPQIFYGTEIGMSFTGRDNDGIRRTDFPGGWKGDMINAFTGVGLGDSQTEIYDFMKELLTWRKEASAIRDGDLIHFGPLAGLYAYFRRSEEETIMVLICNADTNISVDFGRFKEVLAHAESATNVFTGEKIRLLQPFTISSKSAYIFEVDSYYGEEK